MVHAAVGFSRRWALTGAIALTLALPMRSFAQGINEYQVKAAYLYNFAKGTEWPAQALPPNSPLSVCVFGGDEDFLQVLRSTFSGKTVNGRSLQVRHANSAAGLKLCHIAFFRASAPGVGSLLRDLSNGSVLLVGEESGFLSKGGMINFVPNGGKVTFEVNPEPEHSVLHYGVSPRESSQSVTDQKGPRAVKTRVEPVYPEVARNMNLKGTVLLQVQVRADGIVEEVNILGGHPLLAAAARQAVLKWRYKPDSKETTETTRITFGQ